MVGNNLRVEGPVADFLIRLFEIPDKRGDALPVGGEHGLRVVGRNCLALERMQVFVGEEGGFANSIWIQESESTLERGSRRAWLFE